MVAAAHFDYADALSKSILFFEGQRSGKRQRDFPTAFTTMLSWSVLEFGQLMGLEFQHTLESIRWGTDYMLKATSVPDSVVGVVGDPNSDHNCWEKA
ncbi:hypothetical protein DVH24_022722 [Malus domestica]|uniref:cellulase n=1 Tax=Malus domestica TaxID=3750 RepID=A0A498KLG8_MALDO|nr:hypothetical protein DVH24_022722 [Malus domestica]